MIVSRLGLYASVSVTDVMVTAVLALLCRLSGRPLPATLFVTPLLTLGYSSILPLLSVLFCTLTGCPGPRAKSGKLTVTEDRELFNNERGHVILAGRTALPSS